MCSTALARPTARAPWTRQGRGLGLYIVKNIINLHGGRFPSVRMAGETEFSFTLPLAPPQLPGSNNDALGAAAEDQAGPPPFLHGAEFMICSYCFNKLPQWRVRMKAQNR